MPTASEKLRALDEAIDTPRFLGTLNYYIGPGARTLTSREQEKQYYDVKAVLNALPLIVDVVEAAERQHLAAERLRALKPGEFGKDERHARSHLWDTSHHAGRALTALREEVDDRQ